MYLRYALPDKPSKHLRLASPSFLACPAWSFCPVFLSRLALALRRLPPSLSLSLSFAISTTIEIRGPHQSKSDPPSHSPLPKTSNQSQVPYSSFSATKRARPPPPKNAQRCPSKSNLGLVPSVIRRENRLPTSTYPPYVYFSTCETPLLSRVAIPSGRIVETKTRSIPSPAKLQTVLNETTQFSGLIVA